MRKVSISKRLVMNVIVFVMAIVCSLGILPNVVNEQSKTVVTAEAATAGQKNALKAAKDYLDIAPFSKKGLVEQLKFDGYSTKEANYAVKNCGASWKKQAVKAAKSYLDIMSFSKKELKEQLEFDGYTKSESEYGVSKAYK
jgi:hypothetical protein